MSTFANDAKFNAVSNGFELNDQGIYVRSRVWTEAELEHVQKNPHSAPQFTRAAEQNDPDILLKNGGALSFGTTQPKKENDASVVFSGLNPKIRPLDAIQVLHWFLSADEVSKTYEGNAYEKAQSILNRVYDILEFDSVAARLKENGLDPDEVVFCVNDCGFNFNVDYSNEPEFERSLHEKGLGDWPGVELGPVIDAQGGLFRFYTDFNIMAARKEAQGEIVDRTGWDVQMYMMFKLKRHREDIRIFTFESKAPFEITREPAPANDEVINSYHFSTPISGPYADSGQTRAQLGHEYLKTASLEAAALKEFLRLAEVPLSSRPAFQSNADQRRRKKHYIATQHNVFPNIDFETTPDFSDLDRSFVVDNYQHDSTEKGAYQRMTQNAQAVVLGDHAPEITDDWENNFLELFDMWCSLVVDKQVRVETFEGMPFAVVKQKSSFSHNDLSNGSLNWDDPEVEEAFMDYLQNIDPQENPWLAFINFTTYLHEKALVKQEPRFLFKQFEPDDKEDLKGFLEEGFEQQDHKQVEIPDYRTEEYGKDRTDLPEIAIFGSAGTRVAEYTEAARDLAYWAASQGFHVRGGGGKYGVMGATTQGVLDYVDGSDLRARRCHVSLVQMPRTMQFEGAAINPSEMKERQESGKYDYRFMRVTPSFDTRMADLFRSDILVSMAGGIGTFQEILRFMRLKEAGDPELQDKKMIIINQPQPGTAGVINVMDPFLALVPEALKERNLTIVNTVDEAKLEIMRIMQKEPEHTPSYPAP